MLTRIKEIALGWCTSPAPLPFKEVQFPQVDLTEEERKHPFYSLCLKFQTPGYIAYVPKHIQKYVQEKDLYQENENDLMKQARSMCWGRHETKEQYKFRWEHWFESGQMDQMRQIFELNEARDNPVYSKILGDTLIKQIDSTERKYSKKNFIFQLFPKISMKQMIQASYQIAKVALVISCLWFFCALTARKFY